MAEIGDIVTIESLYGEGCGDPECGCTLWVEFDCPICGVEEAKTDIDSLYGSWDSGNIFKCKSCGCRYEFVPTEAHSKPALFVNTIWKILGA